MRNGIYRVWYSNAAGSGSAAVILVDGRFIACDRTHTFLGHYTDANGRFNAEIEVRRYNDRVPRPEFPDLDKFHFLSTGISTEETVAAVNTFREMPESKFDSKLVWCSEL